MCGIAGIYNLNKESVSSELLKRMIDIMKYRGPDDEGFYLDDTAGLGHCRLSIIDLSSTGHQPMSNEDKTIWLVFNGEIYNYRSLTDDLKAKGHSFRSRTDTEVIIHAYEEWGTNCLEKFNGMWAFALWDGKKQRFFCARDRFGVKPFYYHFDGNRLLFASEIKAILQDKSVKRQPNDQIIYDYLANGYVDHTAETFFKGIKQLSAAHYLVIENGQIQTTRYWDLDPAQYLGNISDEEAAARFYELFEDSVRLRLQSEMPVGTCLSGGLDSSSVVCVVNRLLNEGNVSKRIVGEKQKTFSSCFEDDRFDERKFICEVVAKTQVDAQYVFPQGDELFADLPCFIWHQDEPVVVTSPYAQWCVMRLAKESGVKVVLDGQGADEALGGYHVFFTSYLADLARQMRIDKFWHEIKQFCKIHSYPTARRAWLLEIIHPWIPQMILTSRMARKNSIKRFQLDWLNNDFLANNSQEERFYQKYSVYLSNHLYRFLTHERLPSLLRYEDRNSMAFSIEARVPFLDYRLIEFTFALPNSQKMRNGMTKVVLRNAMKGILPEKVRQRVDKMGFVTPEVIWFRTACRDQIAQIIHSNSFRERDYFNAQKIQERFDRFCNEQENDSGLFWRCVNLELWLRTFLD